MVPGSSAASGSVEEGGRVHEGSVAWHAWHRTFGGADPFRGRKLGYFTCKRDLCKGIYIYFIHFFLVIFNGILW